MVDEVGWSWLPRDLVGPELAAGQLDLALQIGLAALRRDVAAARFAIGRVQLARGSAEAAEDSFWAALVAAPSDAGLRLLRARLVFDRDPAALPAALAEIDAVSADHPALADAPMLRAQLLATAGHFDAADATLQSHLALATLAPELALLLAELRLHRGDLDGVFAILPLLGAVCAGRAQLLRQLAALMAALGDADGAAMLAADADALEQGQDPTLGRSR